MKVVWRAVRLGIRRLRRPIVVRRERRNYDKAFRPYVVRALPAHAGTATFDFNSDPTQSGLLQLFGNATWQPDGEIRVDSKAKSSDQVIKEVDEFLGDGPKNKVAVENNR